MRSLCLMAFVQPFKALRFDARRLKEHSLAPEDLEHAVDPPALLQRWRNQGVLLEEPASLYVLELGTGAFGRTKVRFLLGAVEASAWRPLEEVDHAGSLTGTGPVPALAADDHGVMRDLLEDATREGAPNLAAEHNEQIIRLWRLEGGLAKRLRTYLDEVPVRVCGNLGHAGRLLVAVTPLSEPGLRLRPIHRAIRGVTTFQAERFLALVKDWARIYPLEDSLETPAGLERAQEQLAALSHGHHAVLLVLPHGEGKLLRFRQALELTHVPAAPRNPTLRSLDLALLNALVLQTVLGLGEPQSPRHPHVFGVEGLAHLIEQVGRGVFQAGFGLNPPPGWELRAVMEAQQVLPARTLKLEPLPPAGLLYLAPDA